MCGIAGVAAFGSHEPPTPELIRRMCGTIVHRGPDDEGVEVADGVGIGMRRLSIIDLQGGRQPIHNEDRSIRTVFNGEIYNFRELRRDLESRGHTFATASDTEVLVHGFEEWGSELPRHLNGMFAFAIHDARHRRLLLARDHLGVKPLFYALTPRHLVWGSEIKTVLESGLVERTLDLDSLAEFLSWEYVPGTGTLFGTIRKLPAGHLLEVDLQAPSCVSKKYWDVPVEASTDSRGPEEWEEALDAALRESVTRQLVSDVPLGAFLSGGVDSSLMVSAMGRARTFSIGFEESSYDELPWARRVADHLGLDHTSEIIKPDVVELFGKLMHFMDDPIGDFSIFPTYLLSRMARQHVKVALSGDGGDELFGGYETYAAQQHATLLRRVPAWLGRDLVARVARALPPQELKKGPINKLIRFGEGLRHPDDLSHARWRLFLGAALRDLLFTPEARSCWTADPLRHVREALERGKALGPLNACLYADVKSYLCDNILVKVDRMSMATSLEARVPYLDPGLVELAFRVPERLKVSHGRTKILLKRIAARHVPAECVERPKEGFSIPIKHWLKTRFRGLMEDLLDAGRLREQGVLEPRIVERLKQEHLSGVANHSHLLWSLMVFQDWSRRWLAA